MLVDRQIAEHPAEPPGNQHGGRHEICSARRIGVSACRGLGCWNCRAQGAGVAAIRPADDLRLDPASRRVTRGKHLLALTPREFSLLELLLRNTGRVIERETILESVWGYGCEVNENTLEAFVRLLRLKVDTREPKLIHTVRGVGYVMREPER